MTITCTVMQCTRFIKSQINSAQSFLFFLMNFFIIFTINIIIIESTVSGHFLNQSVLQLRRNFH